MENTGTVCTQVADRSIPQVQLPWSRSTSRERSPRESGGREQPPHQRQSYNCGQSGQIWPNFVVWVRSPVGSLVERGGGGGGTF